MSESLSKLARDSVGPLLLGTLLNVMMVTASVHPLVATECAIYTGILRVG